MIYNFVTFSIMAVWFKLLAVFRTKNQLSNQTGGFLNFKTLNQTIKAVWFKKQSGLVRFGGLVRI
jgi:hypothetical protein